MRLALDAHETDQDADTLEPNASVCGEFYAMNTSMYVRCACDMQHTLLFRCFSSVCAAVEWRHEGAASSTVFPAQTLRPALSSLVSGKRFVLCYGMCRRCMYLEAVLLLPRWVVI